MTANWPKRVLKKSSGLGENVFLRSGKLLGDASYALYLCHPIVMSAFAMAWYALGVNTRLPPYAGVGAAVALAIVTSIFVYRWFEFPVTRFLQRPVRAGAEKLLPSDLKPLSQQA